MRSSLRGVPAAVAFLGLALSGLVLAWWWSIFGRLVESGTIPIGRAAACLASASDLCALAQALCTDEHFLGLRWFAPEAAWGAAAVLLAGALLQGLPARPGPARADDPPR